MECGKYHMFLWGVVILIAVVLGLLWMKPDMFRSRQMMTPQREEMMQQGGGMMSSQPAAVEESAAPVEEQPAPMESEEK